jgi:hypothetical protein
VHGHFDRYIDAVEDLLMTDDTTQNRRKKVLCPIERNGKTFWKPLGTAFVNKDNSLNVYLDGLPCNGKLHVRDWDERDDAAGPRREGQAQFSLRSMAGGAGESPDPGVTNDLPF